MFISIRDKSIFLHSEQTRSIYILLNREFSKSAISACGKSRHQNSVVMANKAV